MIARKQQLANLKTYYNSGKPEFVALYGRPRIGKTFLVDHLFSDKYAIKVCGVPGGGSGVQYSAFSIAMRKCGYEGRFYANWMSVFDQLGKFLDTKIRKNKRCVIFIDDIPCFDTPKSHFVKALAHFWNSWCLSRKEVMLVVCGNASPWMDKMLISNHGGLRNCITHQMHINAFTLKETELMLVSQDVHWDRLSVAQFYMAVGGVPYYISLVRKDDTLAKSLNRLFFGEKALLKNEYDHLLSSLFNEPAPYIAILDFLSTCEHGVSRERIADVLEKQDVGHLTDYLTNLQNCDFIRCYFVKDRNRKRKTGGLYQINDFFILFHNTFLKDGTKNANYWSSHHNTSKIISWKGFAFNRLCMAHIRQIRTALRLDHIATNFYSWQTKLFIDGHKIDLLIERADHVTNVCEIRYSESDFCLEKDAERSIRNRCAEFRAETRTSNAVLITLITTYGVQFNEYSSAINSVVTLDNLFR